jgi:isopentenyl phosphate kinase
MGEGTLVVKLGGSVVTDKKVPFFYRGEVVEALGREMASSGKRLVVVHGGGSFGHTAAKRFGLSSSRSNASYDGVAETRTAMFDLDARVCGSLSAAGLRPYPFSPFPLLSAAGTKGASWLRHLLRAGMTPMTFGDVVVEKGGFRVVSGDTIARELCQLLGAERCVFVMDVDGVLDGSGRVIEHLDRASLRLMKRESSLDVTGGITSKVAEALKIASGGTPVAFVSGLKRGELSKALKGQRFHGSQVSVPSRARES